MEGKQGLGPTPSQPQELLSVQEIQRQIDETKQKYKQNDPNNDSVDSAELENEIEDFNSRISKAANQANRDKYQRSRDLLQERVILNAKKEQVNEIVEFTRQLKSLEDELSQKLSLKNLSEKSLSHLLDKYQGAGQLPLEVKENVLRQIEQVNSLKDELYGLMQLEGQKIYDEDKLNQILGRRQEQLQKINKMTRQRDYEKKEIEILNINKIVSLYQLIKPIVTQEPIKKYNEEIKVEDEKIEHLPDDGPKDRPPEENEFLEILDQVKYYKSIPDGCFEKILTQACYALYFKTNQISDEKFSEIGKHLDQYLLDNDNLEPLIIKASTNLLERFEIEGIKDPKIESQLKEIRKITDIEKLLVTKKFFQNILSEYRKFHMEKFFDFVDEVNKVAEIIKGKDIYFLMGTTGCGKSTTIQYLCGSEMFEQKINGLEHIGFRNVRNPDLQQVTCSPFARSETRFIKLIDAEIRSRLGNTMNIPLVDSPGVFDTQNNEIEVSNQLGIQKAICKAATVRPIIILSYKKFGDRGQELKKILSFYGSMIKDMEYLKNFNFFITHSKVDTTIENVGKQLIDILKQEKKSPNKDDRVNQFLQVIIDKIENDEIPLIKPLNSGEIFKIVQNIKGQIEIPQMVFQEAIQKQARICITEQFKIHEREILNSFRSPQHFNNDFVIYKLRQLKRFCQIFSDDQEYIQKYETCLNRLSHILNDNYSSTIKKISDSLSIFNNLILDDINTFSENQKFAEQREGVRKEFLNNLKIDEKIKIVHSAQDYIDELSNQIQIKQLKLGNENNQCSLDSKELHKFFGKIELLHGLGFPKIKTTIDSCFKEFYDELLKKQNYFVKKIKDLSTEDNQESEEAINFYQEIAEFFHQILQGVHICTISLNKQKLEDLHNKINHEFNKKLNIIEEQIKSVLLLGEITLPDMQNLRALSLQDLQQKISSISMTPQLIRLCKNYSEFLNKFNSIMKTFPKLDLYLQTSEKRKTLTRSLSYWVFIQEIILQKHIDNPRPQQERIRGIYTQIQNLINENIVNNEATSRIYTITTNLQLLVQQKQQDIEAMLPQLQQGIIINKNKSKEDNGNSLSEYTMINLKEAVRTIHNLRWIMEAGDADFLEQNKQQLENNLKILVTTIQEQIKDYRLDIENFEDFKYIKQAFKYIDQISQIASILELRIENSYLNRFKPQIDQSIQKIQLFINKQIVNNEEIKEAPKNENKFAYRLIERHECKRIDDYLKYLKEIKSNEYIIQSIENKDNDQKMFQTITIICQEMDNLIRIQPEIINHEFQQNKDLIDKYPQVIVTKIQGEEGNSEENFYKLTDQYLINPTNCIQNYFRLFKHLKTPCFQDLWQRIGQLNNIDEIISTQLIQMAQDINQQIMQASTNAQNTYIQLRVLSRMRILDAYLDRNYFEDYYKICSAKINKYQDNIEKRITTLIDDQSYEEILELLYQQQQIKEDISQQNIDTIKKYMKKKCTELINLIQQGSNSYEDLKREEVLVLNNQINELFSIISQEHQGLKFDKLLGELFIRSQKEIQYFKSNTIKNNQFNQDQIKSLIMRNQFLRAYEQIEYQRKILQVINVENLEKQTWPEDLKKELQQRLEDVHKEFQKEQTISNLIDKKPRELFENLNECYKKFPNAQFFNIALENLISALTNQMNNIKEKVIIKQYESEAAILINESVSNLLYMPQIIKDKFTAQFENLKNDINGKKIKEQQEMIKYFNDDSNNTASISIKIDQMKYDISGIKDEVSQYFKKQCIQAQELLKTDIVQVLQQNIIKLNQFKIQPKIQNILMNEYQGGGDEYSKLCSSINLALEKSKEKIISSFKINSDDFQSAEEDNYSKELQKIDDKLAQTILKQIIFLQNSNQNLSTQIITNLIELFDNLFIEAYNCLKTFETDFQNLRDEEQPEIEKSYGIIKHLEKIDKLLIFLNDQEIQDFYKKQSKQKSMNEMLTFKQQYEKTNHKKLGDQLYSSIDNAKKFFEEKNLMNQNTTNQSIERTRFYKQANRHFLELKFSKECTKSIKNITQQDFEKCQKKLQEEIDKIIDGAKKISESDREINNYNNVKDLDNFLKNLQEVVNTLNIDHEQIFKCQNTIKIVQTNLQDQLKQAKQESIESLNQQPDGKFKIDVKLLKEKLILVQTLNNIDHVSDDCNQTINEIIETMDQVKDKMAQNPETKFQSGFLSNIGKELQMDAEGSKILQKFHVFKGVNRALEAEKYPRRKVGFVLENLKFHNGNKIVNVDQKERDILLMYFKKFKESYKGYINDYIAPEEKIEENLVILKHKVLDQTKRTKVNQKNGSTTYQEIDQNTLDKVPEIIALLFAIFTIQDSRECYHKMQKSGQMKNDQVYLLRPHAGQIIALFRMLGLGHPQQNIIKIQQHPNKTEQIKKYISKDKPLIFDNLAEVKTGEGKSYTLGILSTIFALWGFNVNCGSYSEYLSQRDYDSFKGFFQFIGVQSYIQYGTFNKICEDFINKDGDVRKIVLDRILINPQEQVKMIEQNLRFQEIDGLIPRPQVFLIDEADVFFNKQFLGQIYSPSTRIRCPEVTNLLDYIWSQKNNDLKFYKLKQSTEYLQCKALFKQEYVRLFDACCRDMLQELTRYENHGYKVVDKRIGYLYNDGISYKINYGYKTTFAHYHEYYNNKISKESFDESKSISLSCMRFSYSEIPIQFVLTMGVTGSLAALSDMEYDICRKAFQIQNFTYIPSVYGDSKLHWQHRGNRIKIRTDQQGYYDAIQEEIQENLSSYIFGNDSQEESKQMGQIQESLIQGKSRAVLVFFENKDKLDKFRESTNILNKMKHQALTEEIPTNEEKEKMVSHATYPKSITFATPSFGRGTDFICRDPEVEYNGGIHVILTYMCKQQSEFIQIQGRTARQGNSGSFSMILLDEELKKFKISLFDKDCIDYQEVLGDPWSVLAAKRDERFKKDKEQELESLPIIKNEHDRGLEIKKIMNNDAQNQKICDYLLSINPDGPEDGNPVKTLILMDATGSMSNLLHKAKNSVAIMFEKTSDILKEFKISPELILIQFAVYRNYSSTVDDLFQHSGWESNPQNLRQFMDGIEVSGGICEEAVEIGLQHAIFEANNSGSINLSQVFVIGDAPANPPDSIMRRRSDEKYWQGSKYATPVFWDQECKKLKALNIPVHAFFVDDWAQDNFQQIANITSGTCQFLDINNQVKGQEMLVQMFSKQLLRQIGNSSGNRSLGEKMVDRFVQKFN